MAAHELGARGITADTVSPGFTDTGLLRAVNSEDTLRKAAQSSPFGRLDDPADVADVIAFLTGPDSRWVSDRNIHVNGGVTRLAGP